MLTNGVLINGEHEIYKKSLEDYIRFFLMNRSYSQLQQVQDSRSNIKIINIDESQVSDKRFLKHKCFKNLYKSIYVTLPYDFLVCGERLKLRDIRKLRYELQTIDIINTLFQNSIDLFYNGIKILRSEIKIALFDNYFILQIPDKYNNFTNLVAMMRPYIYDKVSYTTSVIIEKKYILDVKKDDFIVYINGKQSDNYSILDETDRITIRASVAVTNMEVTYIRNINKYGQASLINNHLNLQAINGAYPLPVNNVITFNNGLFINLELIPKTNYIYKANINITEPFNVFYTYLEYAHEDNYYYDNFSWYAKYKDNIMDIINNPVQLPTFINDFNLFTEEISLSDFLENHYDDLAVYNKDKILKTLTYDDELITKIYEIVSTNIPDPLITRKKFYMLDINPSSILRNNNGKENTDPNKYVDFIAPMYLFKLPNVNKYKINVYIDGIRYFDFRYDDRIDGADYIYLKCSRITPTSTLEFEYINTKYNSCRKLKFIGNGTTKLTIVNASTVGILDNRNECRYLRLFDTVNTTYKINIIDVDYDVVTDTLTIESDKRILLNIPCELVNLNYSNSFTLDTKRRGRGISVPLTGLDYIPSDLSYFRVYKNGREIPKKFLSLMNKNKIMYLNVDFTIYELIVVEYLPNKLLEINYNPMVDESGIIDLINGIHSSQDIEFLTPFNQYYTMNGRRLSEKQFKLWCAKGMTVNDLKSQLHFTIVLNDDSTIHRLMTDFYNFYGGTSKRHKFSEYIVTIMDGGPLTNEETDCVLPNIERSGELYYDLYQEFLKHNIVDLSKPLPDYIAFKYKPLIDGGLDNTIMLDTTEQQLYWMPLDATLAQEPDLIQIVDLYYQLLNDVHSIQAIDPNDIPADLYTKYQELFENNVLVVQIPEYAQM